MTDSAVPADADGYDDEPKEGDPEGTAALELAVATVAGGAAGVAGYAIGGPAGAVIGSAAAPYLAALFQKAVSPLWEDRTRRAEKMMETAAEAAELTREELADRAAESEESRFLTDKAVKAAANTIWPEGIRAIGRAYAAGLLAQDAPILNIRLRVLGIMEDLDEMHVRLLDLLVKNEPAIRHGALKAIPHRNPSHVNQHRGGDRPDNPKIWSVGRRKWTTRQISTIAPDLVQVLTSLLEELRGTGLTQENDSAPAEIEQLRYELKGLRKMGMVTTQHSEPAWSPTELGEKILAFYAEAGSEDGQDPGGNPGQATS